MPGRDPAFASPAGVRAAAVDASVEVAENRALDTLMGWLGVYVPTWGTSVTLHVAVFILAAFMVWGPAQPPEEFVYRVQPAPTAPTQVQKRDVRKDQVKSSHGRLRLQDSSFVFRQTTNPVPGIGDLKTDKYIGIIGIGGDRQLGGLEGLGPRPGIFDGEWIKQPAARIVYVVDRSGSMGDSIDLVKMELKRSLMDLAEDSEFHIVFYSSGPPLEMSTRRLVNATDRNKRLAGEFVDPVIAVGGTDPSAAIERAFAVRPDFIYLLTDGEFDRQIVDLVKRLNAGGKVRVSTILFLYRGREAEAVLKEIAGQNGGEFKFVSETDLAEIGGG